MLSAVIARLRAAGCVAAEEEAAELVAVASEAGVLDEGAALEALVRRREAGEPFAYVVGSVMFAGVRVVVGPGVFVPRPQTEAMVERAAALAPSVVVDIGTGSGAIAAAVAARVPAATVVATEVDPDAAAWAHRNGVDVRVGDLDGPLPPALAGTVDVMTVNLPYVPTRAVAYLPGDSRDHEPAVALDGGSDGLALLRRLAPRIPHWLRPGGTVLVEAGGDQGPSASDILTNAGLVDITLHVDDDGDLRMIDARTLA